MSASGQPTRLGASMKPTRLGEWMKQRIQAVAREVGQVAAEEAHAIVDELGQVVMDHMQKAMQRAVTEGSEQLREFLQGRHGGK